MKRHMTFGSTSILLAILALAGTASANDATSLRFECVAQAPSPATAAAPATASAPVDTALKATTDLAMSPTAEYLISKERLTPNEEIFWPGFLTGLRGFEHFYNPVGQPLYFETPLNETSLKLLYLHHEFPNQSQLQGGYVDVFAVQARVALTERLGFIATKDGYSQLRSGLLADDDGWNDIALGFKYALYVDKELDLIVTPGVRYQAGNGDSGVLQGDCQEFSAFVSVAKGFGDLHFIGDLSGRVPLDKDKGNHILQWDLHADYEIFQGVAPLFEVHGLHYLSNGNALPLEVGGLDYSNLGSRFVSGSTVVWASVGGRIKLSPNMSIGAAYEFSLTNKKADIMDQRVTVDIELTW